jgi:probable selenium-dependent hydroxylase accessory protein YqeC
MKLLIAANFACISISEALVERTMLLGEALDLRRGEMTALIGAGGKTTTMLRLARELREEGRKILLTTTTQISEPSKPHVDRLFLAETIDALADTCAPIPAPVIIGAGSAVSEDGQLLGLPSPWLDQLNDGKSFDAILVEADGAASRLFKLPGDAEPVIPASCQLTVWLMAIGILDKPLDSASDHRVEQAEKVFGLTVGQPVTQDLIIQWVKHPAGCWKGIPPACRKVAVINQADSPELVGVARVVITSYTSAEPVKDVLFQ